jgi:hypothetical protein
VHTSVPQLNLPSLGDQSGSNCFPEFMCHTFKAEDREAWSPGETSVSLSLEIPNNTLCRANIIKGKQDQL